MEKNLLNHLKNNIKTELRPSPIDGVGIFAIRAIKKGEQVFPHWEYDNGIYIVEDEKLKEIPKEVRKLIDKYFITKSEGYKAVRLYKGLNFIFNPFCFCNSAHPNPKGVNINNAGIALRNIKKGEEILEGYSN